MSGTGLDAFGMPRLSRWSKAAVRLRSTIESCPVALNQRQDWDRRGKAVHNATDVVLPGGQYSWSSMWHRMLGDFRVATLPRSDFLRQTLPNHLAPSHDVGRCGFVADFCDAAQAVVQGLTRVFPGKARPGRLDGIASINGSPAPASAREARSHRVFEERMRAPSRVPLVAASFSFTRALINDLIFAIGSGLPSGKRKVDRSVRYCSSPLASPAG